LCSYSRQDYLCGTVHEKAVTDQQGRKIYAGYIAREIPGFLRKGGIGNRFLELDMERGR